MLVATSEFTLGHSLLSAEDIAGIVEEHNLDKAVVTDTMSVNTLIPLTEMLGDKLVIGVRLNCVDEAEQAELPIWQPKVYPRDETGMKAIYRLISQAFERPYFFMVPRVEFSQLYDMLRKAPNSFMVSTGDLNNLTTHKNYRTIIDRIEEIIGPWNFIYDICPMPTARFDRINYTSFLYAKEGNPINLFIPAFYKKEDADAFPIHYSINKNVEFNFLNPFHDLFYFDNDNKTLLQKEMLDRLKQRYNWSPQIRYRKHKWPDMYRWKEQAPLIPQLSRNPIEALKKMAIKGFGERLRTKVYGYMPPEEDMKTIYVERMKYELKTLEELGFADYFLLVQELTSWCRNQEIKIGPGRGSVGGSLIAFCLGITDVDPVRFNLMFERFINPTRLDLPDIDLDFMSTRRHEIVEHLNDRYGADNVAGIINYSALQSKSALRSTCRILGMNDNEYSCSKLIPSAFGFTASLDKARKEVQEVHNFAMKYPDVWEKALKVEGTMRNFSTHAAGIIVSSRPLVEDAVIEIRSDVRIINWDKKLCEKQGLIKLDVLGLSTLDIIDLALKYIKERHDIDIDINQIGLDDKAVLAEFAKANTGGVFQFEGGSVKRLLKDLSKTVPLTFDDLVAANALNRPGPIEAGLVQQYVDGKNGELHPIAHESMAEILEPTFNVMVYQEQIMKVAVEYAGYTLPEADNLRKIMGKKLPEKMKAEASKFVNGAVEKHGVDPHTAQAIFDQISKFALYAFNKSHSVEYSLISYICMWFKVYYPVEFYAASLTYIDDKKVRLVINEANKNGYKVLPPNINYSTDKFNPIDSNTIVAPLNKIKYVAAASKHIMEVREEIGRFLTPEHIRHVCVNRLTTTRVMGAMSAVGALDDLYMIPSVVDKTERSKALNEYLPSIPLGHVFIPRKMTIDNEQTPELVALFERLKEEDENFVKPFVGRDARFMVVFDNATKTEAKNEMFTESPNGFKPTSKALYKAGLKREDGYWTGLVKREKKESEKIFDNDTLEKSFNVIKEEIAIIKPTAILCLGSQISRMFDPSMKGGAIDNSGTIIYDKDLDCNIIFGFNPSQIIFNAEYQENLDDLMELVGTMIDI